MAYTIYRLAFPSGMHFGTAQGGLASTTINFCSDGLYAALYAEYMRLYGDQELFELCSSGAFRLSDAFPYKGDTLYIPKPYVNLERKTASVQQSVDRKKVKALQFIPVDKLEEYFRFLSTGLQFPEIDDDFGKKALLTKNSISSEGEDTQLYNVEVFRFAENSGLYFVADCPTHWQERFETVLRSLAMSGLGGKRSAGYGVFHIVDKWEEQDTLSSSAKALFAALHYKADKYMLLSTYLPKAEEVEQLSCGQSTYQLLRRSGFVNQPSYAEQAMKRKQIHMLAAGSVLDFLPEGRIADLCLNGRHSIYRMGLALAMGVKAE